MTAHLARSRKPSRSASAGPPDKEAGAWGIGLANTVACDPVDEEKAEGCEAGIRLIIANGACIHYQNSPRILKFTSNTHFRSLKV